MTDVIGKQILYHLQDSRKGIWLKNISQNLIMKMKKLLINILLTTINISLT